MANRESFASRWISPENMWVSWSLYPASWSSGNLIVNCEYDDPEAPLVAYAAPGVSLYGETGLESGRWRRGRWASRAEFVSRREPSRITELSLENVSERFPADYGEWAVQATVAHIDRLRSFAMGRPAARGALEVADRLQAEVDAVSPGALDRYCEAEVELVEAEAKRRVSRRPFGPERLSPFSLTARQLVDLAIQVLGFAVIYLVYRALREPWAPEGTSVKVEELLSVPVGEFALWLYGKGHVVLPLIFLTWTYFRRHNYFALVRNTIVISVAVVVSAYLIVSPQSVYAVSATESVPTVALPTMPGLHLVVAVIVAFFGVKLSARRHNRIAWTLYPAIVAVVLIISDVRYPWVTFLGAAGVSLVALLISGPLLSRTSLPLGLAGPVGVNPMPSLPRLARLRGLTA